MQCLLAVAECRGRVAVRLDDDPVGAGRQNHGTGWRAELAPDDEGIEEPDRPKLVELLLLGAVREQSDFESLRPEVNQDTGAVRKRTPRPPVRIQVTVEEFVKLDILSRSLHPQLWQYGSQPFASLLLEASVKVPYSTLMLAAV